MNAHIRTSTRKSTSRAAGLVPVNNLCEIACIVLCRIVVPKLAQGWEAKA